MSKLCPNCGKVVEENLTKCSNCGTDLPLEQKKDSPVEEVVDINPIPVIQFNENTNSAAGNSAVNDVLEAVTVPTIEESTDAVVEDIKPEVGGLESAINEVPVVAVEESVTDVVTEESKEESNETKIEEIPVEEKTDEVVKEVTTEEKKETPVEEAKEVVETVAEVEPLLEDKKEKVIEEVKEEITETKDAKEEVAEVIETQTGAEVADVAPEVEEIAEAHPEVESLASAIEEIQVEEKVEETPVEEVKEVVETVSETEPVSEVEPLLDDKKEQIVEETKDIQPEEGSLESAINDVPVVTEVKESNDVIEAVSQPIEEKDKPKAVIDANTVIDVPEGIEEISVDDIVNNELESVSVKVEEENKNTEETVQKVELPEATVGEIDSSILVNMYEQEEKENEHNKMLLAKEEEDRRKREEEARLAKQRMEPKPDLMARVDYVVSNEQGPTSNVRKKKKGSFLPKFFIILFVMLLGAGLYWFFFVKDSKPKEETYETPINTYYKSIEKKDKKGIVSAYVPCARKDENLMNEIEVALASFQDKFSVEYKIKNVEVVNEDDQNNLKTTALGTYCGVENIPNITDYKHVYVSQTIVTDERTTTEIDFWVVQIDKKWYIIPITENVT
ncbi:MAG: hypothetical protein IKQ35_00815 [Bacilli bacterium]|nr:hypothetical protein [Bacilli bacterium]